MSETKRVLCLDDGKEFLFSAKTGIEAMEKLLYTLNLSHQDDNAEIYVCNGRTLSVVHNEKTYACLM